MIEVNMYDRGQHVSQRSTCIMEVNMYDRGQHV